MRTYIAPLGYNSTTVTRPVLSRGIDTGDTVVLLRPAEETDDQQAQEALEDVRRMVQEIEPEVGVTVERVPHDATEQAILRCHDIIKEADGERIVNVGGGARELVVPLTVAVVAGIEEIESVLLFGDIDGGVREIALPHLTAQLPDRVRPTLDAILDVDEFRPISAITSEVDASKSTVARHIQQLEDERLVDTKSEGKTKYVRPSQTGKLLGRP